MLTFISQDITGYLKSGLLQLRSSWKLYSRIHKQLCDLLHKIEPNADLTFFSLDMNQVNELVIDSVADDDEAATNEEDEALQKTINELKTNEQGSEISADGVKRLLAAVSYGYGVFQMFMSFMPPTFLKLFKILGKRNELMLCSDF